MKDFKTLAEFREDKGLPQAEVARHLGITQQGYGAIERGERGLKVKYIKKLAELFEVDISKIVFFALNNNEMLSDHTNTTS